MLETIKEFNDSIAVLKIDLAEWIKDTSIPLETRWATWCEAPSCLKEHAQYAVDFVTLDSDYIGYGCAIHMERYETRDMPYILQYVEEILFEDPEAFGEDFNIDSFKEEILYMNLGSFTYDW